MDINNINEEMEYISEKQAKEIIELLSKFIGSYSIKGNDVTDKEWLKNILQEELPEITDEEAELDSKEIINYIDKFDQNLIDIHKSIENGVSKESWIADKLQEAAVGMSINEYGQTLTAIDSFLYQKNSEIHEALSRNVDGHIKMSRNLDGNIAENMIAKSTEMSAFLQGKNVKVEVRDVFTPNSVDVRAINLETGQYQNYQLKFGQDAEATIRLIKDGNYSNQRLVVPTEQVDKVREAFPSKTVTDHIEAWGVKGKTLTKETVKELQNLAQNDGIMPSMDYSHYQTKDLALSIGKNASTMALQSVVISTGFNVAHRILKDEQINSEEIIELALTSGADTGVKLATAGALQVGIRRGIIKFIPQMTPAGVIANIACVGIENIKILNKVATGELSLVKGLDQMGLVTTSMIGGLLAMGKGALIGAQLTCWIPVIGVPLSIVTGFVGGVIAYLGGSKLGEKIHNAGKKINSMAKTVAKSAWEGLKSATSYVGNKVKSGLNKVKNILF